MDNPMPPLILDSNRNIICPECGTAVKCGSAGLANFEKQHRGTLTCKAAKDKQDRENKMKKDGSILSFLKPRLSSITYNVWTLSGDLVIGYVRLVRRLSEDMEESALRNN